MTRLYQNQVSKVMIVGSEKEIRQSECSPDNVQQSHSETGSVRTPSQRSRSDKSQGKEKVFSRKPQGQANLQSFKLQRRKSQQKIENRDSSKEKMEQPPICPRPLRSPKAENSPTQFTASSRHPSGLSSGPEAEIQCEVGARFKKKAMSRDEIVEVKTYMQRSEIEKYETNSITGSEKGCSGDGEVVRDSGKKSKTQYFNYEEVHGLPQQLDIPENSSESDKIELTSLREKCKSVDETNSLLQKRVKWLREQVQMHLERQAQFKKQQSQLQIQLRQQTQLLEEQRERNRTQTTQLQAALIEVSRLKEFIVELNQSYDTDRQCLISEMQTLKSEKDQQIEELEAKHAERIQSLQQELKKARTESCLQSDRSESYSSTLFEKLISENKYLRVENHMLSRCKQDLGKAKRQNKQIANERDTLKKKIIQNAKKEAMRARMFDDSDSLRSLSELSYSKSQIQ